MKFASTIPFLALAIGVISEPTLTGRKPALVERDVATIKNVINGISGKLTDLDSAVKAFSGDPTRLQSASDAVQSAIESGTQKVSNTDPISATDALQLQPIIESLTASVNTTVNDLIAKKSDFVSAGIGGVVLQALQSQKSASQDLSDAITSKVPEALRGIASQLSSGITDALQRGIIAFQGTESSGGSGSSTAANTPSAATSAASSAAGITGVPSPSANVTIATTGYGGASATSNSPALFTGAAAVNGFTGSVGALAVVAMAFAM
ncbi:cell wall biogenesis protein [Zopfia rhizophila CBS 207.26]|uniref:Cell wall mannoprotein 1 n=1 Tax=Zopfia rhizophila CBS 207.26 TaxID=1314779 RepID=A0A6A6DXT4_9PEZI|nr:cell wall biogenesis protein [Zopfia rhizophila CBS 207.26]